MNKYLLITSSIALIACNEQQQKQEEKIISYPVITVSQKDIISELSFPVNIEGVVNSPVQAKISGYITQVSFRNSSIKPVSTISKGFC